ncbi:hypothetical protein CC78DRAFT_565119 [Lojkania enalia]|uniref:Uncharacterized protein n=1 Tax=Lojkania enalia TaxID=147567 RepID=A0A9P4N9D2_9PLEO|nr:hypothetical protein CC78DRAFT_565119 [Didymosphaeria enalia]
MARGLETAAKGPFELVQAANTNDRFRLLEDPSVPEPNLDVDINPIFRPANFPNAGDEIYQRLQPSLRLASMFLYHDSVLEWFVAPLLGQTRTCTLSYETYLSNPLINKTDSERKKLINRVRQALRCLAHCIHFRFLDSGHERFYARTTMFPIKPVHKPICIPIFGSPESVRIDIRIQYYNFLCNDYARASMCERYRQDFSLAVNILHELCHAVGVMRRGDLKEPRIRLDHPKKSEYGYAWENFMFGGVLNPFDRSSDAISFLMRKMWADDEAAMAAGGKDWTAVPVSYLAQWFRTETWNAIAEHGPTVVSPPPVQLRLRKDASRYLVLSDCAAALDDIRRLQTQVHKFYVGRRSDEIPDSALLILGTEKRLIDTHVLQYYTLPGPSRDIPRGQSYSDFATTPEATCTSSILAKIKAPLIKPSTRASKRSSQLKPRVSKRIKNPSHRIPDYSAAEQDSSCRPMKQLQV